MAAIPHLDHTPLSGGVATVSASAIVVPAQFAEILGSHLGDAGAKVRELGDELRMAHLNMMLRGQSQAQVDHNGARTWWAW